MPKPRYNSRYHVVNLYTPVYLALKKHCDENGIKLGFFASQAVLEALKSARPRGKAE